MKKVCHITTVHKASDERIYFKECLSLAKAGYEIMLIAPEGNLPEPGPVKIITVPEYSGRGRRMFRGTMAALRHARNIKADLYHFHDPELMLMGVILRIYGKKVVYDVHEDLPKQVLYKNWIRWRFVRLLTSRMVSLAEKFCTLFFHGISAATEDIAGHFPSSKTIVLKNFPSLELLHLASPPSILQNGFTVVYAGGISRIRGIREVTEALGILDGMARLLLLGEFDDDNYRQECQSESGWKFVDYRGWIPIQEVYGLMQQANAGIATLYPARNFLRSLPVKAFEYMAFGLPMVMSGFPYWKEVFEACALFVDPRNPQDIADKIRTLAGDQDLSRQLGKSGHHLVINGYSWEMEQLKLQDLYRKILKNGN